MSLRASACDAKQESVPYFSDVQVIDLVLGFLGLAAGGEGNFNANVNQRCNKTFTCIKPYLNISRVDGIFFVADLTLWDFLVDVGISGLYARAGCLTSSNSFSM